MDFFDTSFQFVNLNLETVDSLQSSLQNQYKHRTNACNDISIFQTLKHCLALFLVLKKFLSIRKHVGSCSQLLGSFCLGIQNEKYHRRIKVRLQDSLLVLVRQNIFPLKTYQI